MKCQQLQEMILKHIAHHTVLIVIPGALVYPTGFSRSDLDVIDILSPPQLHQI
jgi:hypothetical protein